MEKNGIANIKIIIDRLLDDKEIKYNDYSDIIFQLRLLSRYFDVISKVLSDNKLTIPWWHEINIEETKGDINE